MRSCVSCDCSFHQVPSTSYKIQLFNFYSQHKSKSPRVVSTNVDDEFPSLSFEISQQWSELGDLPDFTYTHRPVTRSDATSSELDGTPPTPSSDSERSNNRARRLPHVYSYRLLAGQQLSFDLLCHDFLY